MYFTKSLFFQDPFTDADVYIHERTLTPINARAHPIHKLIFLENNLLKKEVEEGMPNRL
jgi:hypothetical protein